MSGTELLAARRERRAATGLGYSPDDGDRCGAARAHRDMHQLLELEAFRHELLHALRRAVPAEWVSLNDVGPVTDTYVTVADPVPPPELVPLFARYARP
ncbi:MAG: hypothetical protein ACTHMY_14655 [Solirubrobacteraceae bacterium]